MVLLEKLGAQFRLDKKLIEHLANVVKVESLEDIAAMEPEDLRACVKDVADINVVLQTSRLKQAWQGIKKAGTLADEAKKKGEVGEDFDTLLPREVLECGADKFWELYHMKWHAAVEPSEYLISKCAKRLASRTVAVDNLWHVKTLVNQLRTAPKRQKVTEKLELVETAADVDVEVPETLVQYLANMFTYCLAWARAGCDKLSSAPSDFKRTTDTALVINVPLDIMMAYHDRAQRMAFRMLRFRGEAETLAWVLSNDEEERAAWTDQFRHSDLTLGQVVQKVMRQREASWTPPAALTTSERSGGQAGGGGGGKPQLAAKGSGGSGLVKVKAEAGVSSSAQSFETVETMTDGRLLCADFNRGKCNSKDCPKGLHLCNRKCRSGRACGFNNHMSKDCRNTKAI